MRAKYCGGASSITATTPAAATPTNSSLRLATVAQNSSTQPTSAIVAPRDSVPTMPTMLSSRPAAPKARVNRLRLPTMR